MADQNDDDRFASLFSGERGTILGRMREESLRDPVSPTIPDAADPVAINEKLVARKTAWAKQGRLLTGEKAERRSRRLPPGQELTKGLPILDLGHRPLVPTNQWELSFSGAIDRPMKLSWDAFQSLPQKDILTDIHCVTAWSSYDVRWRGVATKHILSLVRPRPDVKYVIFLGHDGYRTNLPIEHFVTEEGLIAHTLNGAPLERDHGGPARIVLPHLYFWKSAKWVRQITFLANNAPGYWETRGYHGVGDPWREERYE